MTVSKSRIADIFGLYLGRGLFTHGYCARGSIDERTPYFEYEHQPDNRSIFDLASLTKALVTTPLIFEASLGLNLPLHKTVGEWLKGYEHELDSRLLNIRITELLSHKSGLPAWRNFWICRLGVVSPEDLKTRSNRHRLMVNVLNRAVEAKLPAGEDIYSDVGFILLGYLLEVIRGQDLSVIFDEFSGKFLSDVDVKLSFGADVGDSKQVVPTSWCELRQENLVAQVHDENCAALGGVAGHAGIFGSGRAIASYLQRLLATEIGQRLLEENSRCRVLPVKHPPNGSLMGWRQGADPSALPFGKGASIGHMGFTGVAFWLWPETRDYVMLLTNRVSSGRQTPGIAAMRQEIFAELAVE